MYKRNKFIYMPACNESHKKLNNFLFAQESVKKINK